MPPHGKADCAASTPFSPLRFSIYARDLSRAVVELSRETMGGLSELKAELGQVPGIDTLNVTFGDGKQHITLNGKTATLGIHAGITEIRKALGLSTMNDTPTAPTPVPANEIAPAPAPKAAPVAGSFAASLKSMMDQARAGVAKAQADGLAKVQGAVNKLNEAAAHTSAVTTNMAQTIEDQAAAALAELGQISNLPPG